MTLSILKEIGLTPGEIKIYEALLDLGSSPVSKIHERTGLERRSVYDVLNKLIEKGFITYSVENKKKNYKVSNPHRIVSFLEEKEASVRIRKEEIKIKELPALLEKFKETKQNVSAEIYRGKEGIKTIFEDMLHYNHNYFIGGGYYIIDKMPFFWQHYNKRRIALKVHWHNLVRYEIKEKLIKDRFFHEKVLPKEFSGAPAAIFIYGNKVANVVWGDEFFAFVIENKEIAGNYKKYHAYLWENIAKERNC